VLPPDFSQARRSPASNIDAANIPILPHEGDATMDTYMPAGLLAGFFTEWHCRAFYRRRVRTLSAARIRAFLNNDPRHC